MESGKGSRVAEIRRKHRLKPVGQVLVGITFQVGLYQNRAQIGRILDLRGKGGVLGIDPKKRAIKLCQISRSLGIRLGHQPRHSRIGAGQFTDPDL